MAGSAIVTPEHWKGQSHVLVAPPKWQESEYGPCAGLPVYVGEGEIISCWAPSWRERLRLLFGQRVWMTIVSNAQPPVSLQVMPRQKPDPAAD
jgi:hypothetical protein